MPDQPKSVTLLEVHGDATQCFDHDSIASFAIAFNDAAGRALINRTAKAEILRPVDGKIDVDIIEHNTGHDRLAPVSYTLTKFSKCKISDRPAEQSNANRGCIACNGWHLPQERRTNNINKAVDRIELYKEELIVTFERVLRPENGCNQHDDLDRSLDQRLDVTEPEANQA